MVLMLGKYNRLSIFDAMELPTILMQDYTYSLPENRIAQYPLAHRDQAKLLEYRAGHIDHLQFNNLTDRLPENALLFFNNTKVIQARFLFKKESGAGIEIFLLQPVLPSVLLSTALAASPQCTWKCAIGNMKRWTDGIVLEKKVDHLTITAKLLDRTDGIVEFSWTPATSHFAEIIHAAGAMPLPPYLDRPAESSDAERYQTVYSSIEGAVAAPTAGLHFTDEVMHKIAEKRIQTDFLTLHVSAGTFLPVKVENAVDHSMHSEQIIVTKRNILHLLAADKKSIAVGTTALRTLESIFWFGDRLVKNPSTEFKIDKLQPYQSDTTATREEALQAILSRMDQLSVDELVGHTSIFILPGYQFRICEGLITNFHQPGSTLLLLIAAFIGPDWKQVYKEALDNSYRFLSYGDSSLLLP